MQWHEAINKLRPYVFKISTPQGSGTGFLVSRSVTAGLCAVATAAHVIDHAHYWEEPIRLFHLDSGQSIVLRPAERAIHVDADLDSAGVVFEARDLLLPNETFPLLEKDKFIKPGVEIGWLGFPAIPAASLCFFSGRVSAYLEEMSTYLVDGVAINGVSGGPAFRLAGDLLELMGIVSAYIPNRATGDVLPGVAVVRDATQFHRLSERFRSLDEAKTEETAPSEVAPVESTNPASPTKVQRQGKT
jgi:hypothetical protein